jgi:hypothetical protein
VYYSRIQTADLDGPGHGGDIIARFPTGMRVYQYTPPAGTKDINGGTWKLISKDGPFSDRDGYAEPALYLTIHAIGATGNQPGQLMGQTHSGTFVYNWTGSGWVRASASQGSALMDYLEDPSYYLDYQWAPLAINSRVEPVAIFRAPDQPTPNYPPRHPGVIERGVIGAYQVPAVGGVPAHWVFLRRVPAGGPFPDSTCPDAQDQAHRCFGGSASYYETLRFAQNIDGSGLSDVLGRLAGGLYVYELSADGSTWTALPTLTDLKGSAYEANPPPPGRWSSIRVGDVLGNGRDQVPALDGSVLQVSSYDPTSKSWTKLTPASPLDLGGDMWNKECTSPGSCNDPSYYSTIEVGDVTGSRHDAVIARGPYGIRTWFYDLHGNSGWTSWLPQDTSSYPQFTGGQANAFTELNSLAKPVLPLGAVTVRDVWTGENAPSPSSLAALRQAILGFAGCAGATNGNPPYAACTPPAASSGFTGSDWTEVVNQVLTEIGWAQDADDYFAQLDTVRQKLFIAQGAELDAIAGKLGLDGAAGNETSVKPSEITGLVLRIIGALAEKIPVLGQGLAIAGDLVSVLGSDSPTLTSEFPAKYADLKDKFATMVTEIDKGLEVQSQEVRSNYGLLSLIAQLTTGQGPWRNPDLVGLESADAEGFALWSYQQLVPTVYARYAVTGCVKFGDQGRVKCTLTAPGPETIGTAPDFTTIGPLPTPGGGLFGQNATPCQDLIGGPGVICDFHQLHDVDSTLATKIWGPVSDTCNYQPGNAATKWTFGCNLAVSKASSVSLVDGPANGWEFHNYCGSPNTNHGTCAGANGGAAVGANSRVTLTGSITLPEGFRVTSATIAPDRLLYEPAGPDGGSLEVVDRDSGRQLGAVRMARRGPPGEFSDPSGGVRARLELGKVSDDGRSYDLTLSGVNVKVPDACLALSASNALSTPPFTLTSTLELSDGPQTHIVSLPGVWNCVRNRAGDISELRSAAAPRLPQRPGLAVTLAGPLVLGPGAGVIYEVGVHNRRRGPRQPLISSLWHVLVQATAAEDSGAAAAVARLRAVGRLAQLPRGQSRTLRLRVHVPSSATGRFCVVVAATADPARPASTRICARIASPRTAGLG